jgi:hypothetical protein
MDAVESVARAKNGTAIAPVDIMTTPGQRLTTNDYRNHPLSELCHRLSGADLEEG